MRVLLDHCVPRRLRRALPGHEVKTASEMGWNALSNGKLLAEAAKCFEVVLTVDRNLKHQQSLDRLPVAIIVLVADDNRFATLAPLADKIEAALMNLNPKCLVEVS